MEGCALSGPDHAKQPHIQCAPGSVAPFVLLPGDPGRVQRVAEMLDTCREVAYNREFRTITGIYRGMPVSATSTGIGGASAAIAVEELLRIGARILVRIGSCGAMQPGMRVGGLVLAVAAVREDGASRMYVPGGYPAVADPELVRALAEAAGDLRVPAYTGLVRSHDSFYTDRESELMDFWARKGILASDMETAALFTVARLRGGRAASILNVVVPAGGDLEAGIDNLATGQDAASQGEKAEIQVALEGLFRIWQKQNQQEV